MAGIYRTTCPDGKVVYSDGSGNLCHVDGVPPASRTPQQNSEDYKQAKDLIKEAQKRIPKLIDYLRYLEYLRHYSPLRFDRVMRELQREDPETWLKLQRYPQFRPLHQTATGLKAAEKTLSAGIGLATGKFTGSTEKWMETTLKDMMKRDRFGPYADVLGSKASTLPSPKATYYSNSRLGQHLKTEDERMATVGSAVTKELESSRAAKRMSAATAATRVLGPLVDLGIGALDVDFFKGISYFRGIEIAEELKRKGVLDSDEAYQLPRLLAAGKYDEVVKMIDAGATRAGLKK